MAQLRPIKPLQKNSDQSNHCKKQHFLVLWINLINRIRELIFQRTLIEMKKNYFGENYRKTGKKSHI